MLWLVGGLAGLVHRTANGLLNDEGPLTPEGWAESGDVSTVIRDLLPSLAP